MPPYHSPMCICLSVCVSVCPSAPFYPSSPSFSQELHGISPKIRIRNSIDGKAYTVLWDQVSHVAGCCGLRSADLGSPVGVQHPRAGSRTPSSPGVRHVRIPTFTQLLFLPPPENPLCQNTPQIGRSRLARRQAAPSGRRSGFANVNLTETRDSQRFRNV